MGPFNAEVRLYGDRAAAVRAAAAVRREFDAVDRACNLFHADSELSRLNAGAGREPFACSGLLWELLMESKRHFALSGGAFDITVRPLMDLWGFYRVRLILPGDDEVAAARAHVGLEKVVFDTARHTVFFTDPEVRLDLGGIAKGYAVDRAARAARACGITKGLINLAGNAACLPDQPRMKPAYRSAVRHPKDPNRILGWVELRGEAVATSGNYERYVVIDGRRYTHLMDPTTGRPVSGILSATVVSPRAVDTDGLSTAVFIRGEAFAREICRTIPGTRVLIVTEDPAAPDGMRVVTVGDGWHLP
jgi:thiamine biosynthesis lipoprotein